MSWLSNATGIHISPHGVKIEPLKALGTALTVGSFGGLSGIGAALGRIPGVAAAGGALAGAAKAIPGVTAAGSALGGALGRVPGASAVGNTLLHGFGSAGAIGGGAGQAAGKVAGAAQGGEAPNEGVYEGIGGYDPVTGAGTQATAPTQAGQSIWGKVGDVLGKPGVAQAGADVLGGILQGNAAAAQNQQKAQQFNRTQGLTEANSALDAQRQQAAAPLRDQALYMLRQRMGMPQQAFVPHDIYNQSYGSGPAQLGGMSLTNRNTLNQANQLYQPGMGGVNSALLDAYVKKYGSLK